MVEITEEEVRKTAELAKLDIDAQEIQGMRYQLQELLDYAAVVTEAGDGDAAFIRADFQETNPPPPAACVLKQEEVLALAPQVSHGLIRVPRVMGDE